MEEQKKGIADVQEELPTETMADYQKELEASFRTVNEGDVISGTVIGVNETEVTLDLGYYAPGVIKAEDLSRDPGFSILADVHIGDKLEGTVVKKDDGAGNIALSCVEAAQTLGWDRLLAYQEEKKDTYGKGERGGKSGRCGIRGGNPRIYPGFPARA